MCIIKESSQNVAIIGDCMLSMKNVIFKYEYHKIDFNLAWLESTVCTFVLVLNWQTLLNIQLSAINSVGLTPAVLAMSCGYFAFS